jgi:hypothetical protein
MWWLLLVLAIAVSLFSLYQMKLPHKAVSEMVIGVVPEDPQSLADQAGVDIETYSLARVGQSEEGLSSDRAKVAVMYACRNHAQRAGKTIADIVTKGNPKRSDYTQANGHYGRQGIHPYCSTIANPTAHTLILADTVMTGDAVNEVGAAEYWDNPHAQDALHLTSPEKYESSAQIAADREASGLTLLTLDGISTRFWVS